MVSEKIGNKISELRRAKGINQKEFASEIGVSQPSLIKFEKGETDIIPIGVAKKLAQKLGVSFNELFEIEVSVAAASEVKSLLNEKNAKIADLQKQIEQKDLLITMLENENERLENQEAFLRIDVLFEDLMQDELEFRKVEEGEYKNRLNGYKSVTIENLKLQIETILQNEVLTTEKIIEIIFSSETFCYLIENESNNKNEFIDKCTNYINQFLTITKDKIEMYIDKYISTIWDSGNDKKKRKTRKIVSVSFVRL